MYFLSFVVCMCRYFNQIAQIYLIQMASQDLFLWKSLAF